MSCLMRFLVFGFCKRLIGYVCTIFQRVIFKNIPVDRGVYSQLRFPFCFEKVDFQILEKRESKQIEAMISSNSKFDFEKL